jgi:hypothetical protein
MEHPVGLEPTFSAWKAVVLPLDDGCKLVPRSRIEREPSGLQSDVQADYTISAFDCTGKLVAGAGFDPAALDL